MALLGILVRKYVSGSFSKQQHSLQPGRLGLLGNSNRPFGSFSQPFTCPLFLSARALQATLCREIHQAAIDSVNPLPVCPAACICLWQSCAPSPASPEGPGQTRSHSTLLLIQRRAGHNCQEQGRADTIVQEP